jgi:hypothetical protein
MNDNRLEQALAFANYRQTLNNQLHKLKIKSRGDLIFSKNGGNFTINRELICFLQLLKNENVNETILVDEVGVPVQITDVSMLLAEILQRYNAVTADYYKEYQLIRKSRNVKLVVELKEE